MLVPGVDHGHRLRADHPLRHVLDINRFEGRHITATRPPRVHAPIKRAGDGVETNPQQLAPRLLVLRVSPARQHDRPASCDEPAHPRAHRPVDTDVVAPWDMAAVVIASWPD